MITIGITGTLGAGKGTIVDYLVREKSFRHFSVREYLLEKIRETGMPEDRNSMFALGNRLRAQHGPSFVVDQLYLRAQASGSNSVIESIRTTGEVESLRKKGHFTLLAVDADPHIRYERIVLRASETDRVTYETFIENEQRESVSTDPAVQNLQACIRMADHVIMNNGTIEDLYEQIGKILKF